MLSHKAHSRKTIPYIQDLHWVGGGAQARHIGATGTGKTMQKNGMEKEEGTGGKRCAWKKRHHFLQTE